MREEAWKVHEKDKLGIKIAIRQLVSMDVWGLLMVLVECRSNDNRLMV